MTQVELTERILAFENGTLDENETIELFQELIDNGRAWTLVSGINPLSWDFELID
jgi:hypothetical protein